MKLLRVLFTAFVSMILLFSCEQQESIEPENVFKPFVKSGLSLDETQNLTPLLSHIQSQNANGRLGGFGEIGELNLKNIMEVLAKEGQRAPNYTIPIKNDDPSIHEYLILASRSDQYYGYIMHYKQSDSSVFKLGTFSGLFQIFDLNRATISSATFEKGVLIQHHLRDESNSASGRTEGEGFELPDCCVCIPEYGDWYQVSGIGHGPFGLGEMRRDVIALHCDCGEENCGSGGETTGGEGGEGGTLGGGGGGIGTPITGGGGTIGGGGGGTTGGTGTPPDDDEEEEEEEEVYDVIGLDDDIFYREEEIRFLLEEDPFALLDIDCEELSEKWANLAEHSPSQQVLNRIEDLNENGYGIEVQYLEDAAGAVVNLDYFPVEISQLPENPATGETFTGNEFFSYLRENFDDLCFNDDTSFGPYNDTESAKWNSNDYLGSVMRFDIKLRDPFFGVLQIGQQDGSVICSDQHANSWTFSTIYSSQDYSHPVSGNREFGLTSNPDGTYTFFTRGVDRIHELTDIGMGRLMDYGAFDGGEDIWSSLQENLSNFVNASANGGQASVANPTIKRIDNDLLEDVLNGIKPVSELGCND